MDANERSLTRRDLGVVVLLCVVTLTLYAFYWIPKLGDDVNRILGRRKYRFGLMVVLGIFTLGLALCVIEILYAYDLQRNEACRGLPHPVRNLGGTVVALNVVAILTAVFTAGLGAIVSIALGFWATWLVQRTINELAETRIAGAERMKEIVDAC